MSSSEVEYGLNRRSTSAVRHNDGEVSVHRWGDVVSPLRGPKVPFSEASRAVFRRYFMEQLNNDQQVFYAHFRGTAEERSRSEAYLMKKLPEVVARDAWREVLQGNRKGFPGNSGVFQDKGIVAPYLLISAVSLMVPLTVPWLVANHPWWYKFLAGLAGLAGLIALSYILERVESLLNPMGHGQVLWLLTVLALDSGLLAWLFSGRPSGWVFYVTALAAFWVFLALIITFDLLVSLFIAVLGRVKVTRYLDAELTDTFLIILDTLSGDAPDLTQAAAECHYAANMMEENWRQLITVPFLKADLRQRVQGIARSIAAGMHEIGLCITFSTKGVDLNESFEAKWMDIMARQLTALTTFRYGDLCTAEVDQANVRPRLERMLRSLRSLIAAVTPIILLLVVPKVFNFVIEPGLYGTLLTVSLAWLGIYVLSWLDPKALATVTSLGGFSSFMGKLGK